MKDLAYYNGEIAPIEELKIPALDRAVYFGDGAYNVASIFDGKFYNLDKHVERFIDNLKFIDITPPMEAKEMIELFEDLLTKVDHIYRGTIFFQVSRGTDIRHHEYPQSNVKSNLLVFIRECKFPDITKPLKIITYPDLRHSMCNVKTLSILPNIIASQKALEMGCDEAALIRDGYLTECSHTALAILKDGKFISHPVGPYVLHSVGRSNVIEICGELNIPVEERPFTLEELYNADEVLIMSCIKLCSYVSSVDGKPVAGRGKDIIEKIQKRYKERIVEALGPVFDKE